MWAADSTRTSAERRILIPAARDAFSNRIVRWRCSDRYDTTDLILGALELAVWSRNARSGQSVHHSGALLEPRVRGVIATPARGLTVTLRPSNLMRKV
ncbi:hypothetical protein GCM10009608_46530 [Pseudonocardia alaniniphila]